MKVIVEKVRKIGNHGQIKIEKLGTIWIEKFTIFQKLF